MLQTNYRNANLRVEVDGDLTVRLFINNMMRSEGSLRDTSRTLQLSSSVQTDYEWHEFIEATVSLSDEQISVTLNANGVVIASNTIAALNLDQS